MLCGICFEDYATGEFQQLACGHSFCNTCISMCTANSLCPHSMCPAARSMDIVVDEADAPLDPDLMDEQDSENDAVEKHHNRIAVAARLPLFMKLEEKTPCEGRKGQFQCVNVARITFTGCRHSTCFDCFGKRLQQIAKFNDPPTCPTHRCSNRLTKTEIKRMAERSGFAEICAKILATMKGDDLPREDRQPGKDEVRVYCSSHGNDQNTKLMYIPIVCTFGDMINAFMQVLRIDKTFASTDLHIYVRTITEAGKTKFEQLNLKQLSRKSIRDSIIADKTHVVFDLKNEIGKL